MATTTKERLAQMVGGEADGGAIKDTEWYEEGGGDEWDDGDGDGAWAAEDEEYWGDEAEGGEDDWDDDDDEGEEEEEEDAREEWPKEEGILQRCAMGGVNRQRNVGIHTIEIYYPQFYLKQLEMEEYDSRPDRYGPSVIGKYTKGIGMTEARFPTDDEDPVSFSMTVTHRLVERMQRDGFNLTAMYAPDGETMNPWNAFGRIDIGSESLVDRSKSMKTYVMDMFERYGDEANIEGVDMYNACYGGQAAGLCVLNWVESDRWDGRYGLAIATDISEAHSSTLFTVGAACTGTLYFPEAPIAHHSYRASAILHRLDFFKPVGWKSMAPLVDGKYSIDAYMTCIELCYATLKKKLNDRRVFSVSDYNVFHTGGGFHVVKKAFERMCRADDPESSYERKQELVQERLIPSVHLLKIIGPCHTVSSFLNTGSVIMSQWEKALGKVLLVFTYGSGCAASLYQLRFDDLAWMQPLASWKVEFYRNAIYQPPSTLIHDVYCATWMKFDYKPCGREMFQIDPWKYELDVYYLMEIDKWGRRFYHRGGVIAPELDKKYELRVDQAEGRPKRDAFRLYTDRPAEKERTLEDDWKKLEYDFVFDGAAADQEEVIERTHAKGNPTHSIVTVELPANGPGLEALEHDGKEHTYQIVGSWTGFKELEDMEDDGEGNFQFTVTVGENCWEDFYIVQDSDWDCKIFPATDRSWKAKPCVGPHPGGARLRRWRLDARDADGVPEEDVGKPGDQYLVLFHWRKGCLKNLEWDKLEGERGEYRRGTYHLAGSWTCWDFEPMISQGEGEWTVEAQLTWLGLEFVLARDGDLAQLICPAGPDGAVRRGGAATAEPSVAAGPDAHARAVQRAARWKIDGAIGDRFAIDFARAPEAPEDLRVSWRRLGAAAVSDPAPRYFLVGDCNAWGEAGHLEMLRVGSTNTFSCKLELRSKQENFRIVLFKRADLALRPDKSQVTQMQAHAVLGPSPAPEEQYWTVGKAGTDKAKAGDVFTVMYETEAKKISWRKL